MHFTKSFQVNQTQTTSWCGLSWVHCEWVWVCLECSHMPNNAESFFLLLFYCDLRAERDQGWIHPQFGSIKGGWGHVKTSLHPWHGCCFMSCKENKCRHGVDRVSTYFCFSSVCALLVWFLCLWLGLRVQGEKVENYIFSILGEGLNSPWLTSFIVKQLQNHRANLKTRRKARLLTSSFP